MTEHTPPTIAAEPVAGLAPTVAALGGIAATWWLVLGLHLTPAMFAILITFGGTRALSVRLESLRPGIRHAKGWALVLMVAVVGGAVAALVEQGAEAAAAGGGLTGLLQQMANALDQLRRLLPGWLAVHLPVSLESLRHAAVAWLRAHAAQAQLWGGHTVRGVGYTVAGVVIGALAALQLPVQAAPPGTDPPLTAALRRGFDGLVSSFTAFVFAQLRIAAINSALTALYLLVVLPLLGARLPFAGTLVVATFLASLLPVVGNLVSNTMIVVVSLTHSLVVAGLSLVWLVAIHKFEYFLNAHILGSRIRAHAWELLIAMLTLEAMFGLAGVISAPVIYAQVKSTLHERGWI